MQEVWTHDLARTDVLLRAGVPEWVLRSRLRRGRWVKVLPHVVCRTTGTLSPDQRRHAALIYAGPNALLSHASAASLHGLTAEPGVVHVRVPHGRNLRSADFARVHQTNRPAAATFVDDLPLTLPARSAIDVALTATKLSDARAPVCAAVQRRRATVDELRVELDRLPQRGSRFVRQAVEEVSAGVKAVSEAEFYTLIKSSHLPMPEFNVRIKTADGTKEVDALWRRLRAGAEIDGQLYHLDAASWTRDLARQNALLGVGIALIRFPVLRLRQQPAGVLDELERFLETRAKQLGLTLLG